MSGGEESMREVGRERGAKKNLEDSEWADGYGSKEK